MNRRVLKAKAADLMLTVIVTVFLGTLFMSIIWIIRGIYHSINWECIFK